MTSPKRNDPCPCGSGAKYKKCCLPRDEAETHRAAAAALEASRAVPLPPEPTEEDWAIEDELDADATLAAAVDRPFDEDPAPWELALFAETHETFRQARARDEAWQKTPALPGEVAELDDLDLQARLQGLGVAASKEAFRQAARAAADRGEPSGWAVAKAWRAGLGSRKLARGERDFLALAACELWRRWFPEVLSTDALEDAVEEGRALLEEEKVEEAFELWHELLDEVLARKPAGARSLADVKAAGDPVYLSAWLEDWLDAIHERAQEDPEAALEGLDLVEAIREALPEQGGPSGGTTSAARASFLVALGRDREALAEARALRDAHPDLGVGYVALADTIVGTGGRDPACYEQALEVLWAAKSRPVTDAKEWELERRYKELQRLLGRARAGS